MSTETKHSREPIWVTQPRDGVALVEIRRPERLNTLTLRVGTALHRALANIAADTTIRVVIVTGAGDAFCAGIDLNGFEDDDLVDSEGVVGRMMTRQRELAQLSQRLHDLPQPVIAAVNGPAAGAGLALVCASDVRIASRSAFFAVSFIKAGYSACDLGVSWLLPRIVGAGRAHELMLTGRRFDSHEALVAGLVCDVVDDDALLDRAMEVAAQIISNPPLSVEMTKAGMWTALETPSFDASVEFENRQQVFTALTEDQPEASAAFLEKRAAVYRRR